MLGPIFYDLGILESPDVIERSAVDLLGQHVGHTVPKTRELLDGAIGKVLVIDEAQRLASGGYTAEAVDELMATARLLSGRIVIILIGQSGGIDDLMNSSNGLSRCSLMRSSSRTSAPTNA